jgi:uncharacterized membrane protein
MASSGSTVNYNHTREMIGSVMRFLYFFMIWMIFYWRVMRENFHITQRNNIDINKKRRKRKIQNIKMAKNK